jgi:hypothetical protein
LIRGLRPSSKILHHIQITSFVQTVGHGDAPTGRQKKEQRMKIGLIGMGTAGRLPISLHVGYAQQTSPAQGRAVPQNSAPTAPASPAAPAGCTGTPDPYKNYACHDTYLGTNVFDRLYNYDRFEWASLGHRRIRMRPLGPGT